MDASGNCNLFYEGACTQGTTSGETYYAISGFRELSKTTADTCTHHVKLEENAKQVSICKAVTLAIHSTTAAQETACEAVKFEGGSDFCYVEKYDTATCGGTSANYGSTGTITGGTSFSLCKSGCDALGDRCMEFYFDDDTTKACTYYSGECTKTVAAAKDSIWERVPCCYWTSPTLITADSLCSNSAEATMNNKADATWNTGYEFTKL
jgi:hypothetical protein